MLLGGIQGRQLRICSYILEIQNGGSDVADDFLKFKRICLNISNWYSTRLIKKLINPNLAQIFLDHSAAEFLTLCLNKWFEILNF